MTLWPGWVTSIRQHERGTFLCVGIMNKIMRTDSIYDTMKETVKQRGHEMGKNDFTRMVVGMVIMTKYNRKTYTVDDVSWTDNPSKTFPVSLYLQNALQNKIA